MLAAFVVYTGISTWFNAIELKRIHTIKKRDGYKFDASDINYDKAATIVMVIAICFMAGLLGGIVGIAGGIILNPIFLQLELLP